MDGAKPSFISASELYAGIDTAKAPLAVDAQRGGRKCQSGHDHRRSSLATRLRRLSSRYRHLEPAGQALRAAFVDRINVAHC